MPFHFSLRPLSADALVEGRRQEEAATRNGERSQIKFNQDGDGDDVDDCHDDDDYCHNDDRETG